MASANNHIDLITPQEELDRIAAIEQLLKECRAQLSVCKSASERKDIIISIRGYEFQLQQIRK